MGIAFEMVVNELANSLQRGPWCLISEPPFFRRQTCSRVVNVEVNRSQIEQTWLEVYHVPSDWRQKSRKSRLQIVVLLHESRNDKQKACRQSRKLDAIIGKSVQSKVEVPV
jgi:hypothetical protein